MLILQIAAGVALGLWAYNYMAEGWRIWKVERRLW